MSAIVARITGFNQAETKFLSGTSYNGYDWKQRMAILTAYKRGEAGPGFTFAGKPCGFCGDPDRAPGEWHSEDYSPPFSFHPPQTYPVCKSCHGRLHKRFNRLPEEWELFCRHVEAGGYGREFTTLYPPAKRAALCAMIAEGLMVEIARLRPQVVEYPWWRALTLDPESLDAPWARPRPWRARPDEQAYSRAIMSAAPTATEWTMLKFHARAPRRTVTMRIVADEVLGSSRPQSANLAYGGLAKRIGQNLVWAPDQRADGSSFWMSVIAEGWHPPTKASQPRDYELVMVPTLTDSIINWDRDSAPL